MTPQLARDAVLSAIWSYWGSKRESPAVPLRRDIDPCEIPALLPHIQLVDRVDDRGFRYRLTGTAVVQGYGFDPTGKLVDDILPPDRRAVANEQYGLVWEARRPLFTRGRHLKRNGLPIAVSRIVLPLSLDGASVGMLLLGQTFAAPTAEELAMGSGVEIDADTVEILEILPDREAA